MGITKALKHYVTNQLQTLMGCIDLAETAKTPAERSQYLARAREVIRKLDAALGEAIIPSIRRTP